ncbi:MAG: ribonuclease M5 [Bacilli bacterium]|nr:ribonuclease M5 [Bacilli bacterium]
MYLPYVLVVEGAMDQSFLSQFLDCDFIQTNGSEVSRETIEYISEVAKTRDVVLLTDPDSPGERIRSRIAEEVPSCKHAFVRKAHAIKGKKVGVAECDKEEVLRALSHIVPSFAEAKGTLTFADLAELGIVGGPCSSAKREKVAEAFHVGRCNGKTLLKRLNALNVSEEDLERALHG